MSKNNIQLLNISQAAIKIGLINSKNKKPSTHTLRFWETKFKQLRPTILHGNRRYYTTKDIAVIKMIFFLLKNQGLTINGAIKAINENSKKLDDTKTTSIKADYYKKIIKEKSKKILKKIKNING
jgi:DNA-binding transcriptional MerR regulator